MHTSTVCVSPAGPLARRSRRFPTPVPRARMNKRARCRHALARRAGRGNVLKRLAARPPTRIAPIQNVFQSRAVPIRPSPFGPPRHSRPARLGHRSRCAHARLNPTDHHDRSRRHALERAGGGGIAGARYDRAPVHGSAWTAGVALLACAAGRPRFRTPRPIRSPAARQVSGNVCSTGHDSDSRGCRAATGSAWPGCAVCGRHPGAAVGRGAILVIVYPWETVR